MPETVLTAEPRSELGSADSRRQRTAGRVPAVVYGHGTEPLAVTVDARALRHALSGAAGANALLDLRVGAERHLAIAREVQHHPVRRSVNHVDFQVVSRDEVVSAEVPVILVGESLEINRAGGTVEHVVTTLTVHARPADIPSSVELDVSELVVGQTLHVSDLQQIPGVRYDADPGTVLVAAPAPRGGAAEAAAEAAGASQP